MILILNWKRLAIMITIVSLTTQVTIGMSLGLEKRELLDVITVLCKLFDYLDGPLLPLGAAIFISIVTQSILGITGGWIFANLSATVMFPKIRAIMAMYGKRKSELIYVAKSLLDKELSDHWDMLNNIGTRAGWAVVTDKILPLSKSFLKSTTAKHFAMTTLGGALEIYRDRGFRNFNDDFLNEILIRKNKLQRFYVIDLDFLTTFNLKGRSEEEKKAMRWFVTTLHDNEFAELFYISKKEFQAVANQTSNLSRDMLDILLFDGRLVSGIKNNPVTFKVEYAPEDPQDMRPRCFLYAIDDDDKLTIYKQFFEHLASHCINKSRQESGLIIQRIKDEGLGAQYGIE